MKRRRVEIARALQASNAVRVGTREHQRSAQLKMGSRIAGPLPRRPASLREEPRRIRVARGGVGEFGGTRVADGIDHTRQPELAEGARVVALRDERASQGRRIHGDGWSAQYTDGLAESRQERSREHEQPHTEGQPIGRVGVPVPCRGSGFVLFAWLHPFRTVAEPTPGKEDPSIVHLSGQREG